MEIQPNHQPEKPVPSSTKLDFSYTLLKGGIQYKSEGFSFEENKVLLKLMVTRSRIRLYTICMTLFVALVGFLGKDAFTLLKALLWPP